jgi:hypothetical protein
MGGYRVGGPHDSYAFEPDDGWTVFSVVRPHHEVVASLLQRGTRMMADNEWTTAYDRMVETWAPDGELYWRTRLCTNWQQFPDVQIPKLKANPAKVGVSGWGARWKEIVPEVVLDKIRTNPVFQKEYEKYHWEMP